MTAAVFTGVVSVTPTYTNDSPRLIKRLFNSTASIGCRSGIALRAENEQDHCGQQTDTGCCSKMQSHDETHLVRERDWLTCTGDKQRDVLVDEGRPHLEQDCQASIL